MEGFSGFSRRSGPARIGLEGQSVIAEGAITEGVNHAG
jgi:hypothetical protein